MHRNRVHFNATIGYIEVNSGSEKRICIIINIIIIIIAIIISTHRAACRYKTGLQRTGHLSTVY
jgi:hypothetical protein